MARKREKESKKEKDRDMVSAENEKSSHAIVALSLKRVDYFDERPW